MKIRLYLVAALSVFLLGQMMAPRGVCADEPMVPLSGQQPRVEGVETWPSAPWDQVLRMQIRFKIRNQELFKQFGEEQHDLRSPNYQRALTDEEFMADFAPTAADFEAVADWLRKAGFEIEEAYHGKVSYIKFNGTVAQAARAFGTPIVMSPIGKYTNASAPPIPARFADVISYVLGLEDFTTVVPDFQQGTNPVGFGVSDLRTFYNISPLLSSGGDGSGQCIAIVSVSNFLDAAPTAFNQTFGLPAFSASNLSRVFASGGADPGRTSDETEALVGIEWAHAVAPGAPIRVYIGDPSLPNSSGAVDAITRAVIDDACATISVPFDFCTLSASFFTDTLAPLFSTAAMTNMQSVFVASGNQGAAGRVLDPTTGQCVTGTSRNAKETAASPDVTAVGGTQFTPVYDASNNNVGFVSETVWKDATGAAGAARVRCSQSRPIRRASACPMTRSGTSQTWRWGRALPRPASTWASQKEPPAC